MNMKNVKDEIIIIEDCENDNGCARKTIPQIYWEELYTGRYYNEYEDYYDYN